VTGAAWADGCADRSRHSAAASRAGTFDAQDSSTSLTHLRHYHVPCDITARVIDLERISLIRGFRNQGTEDVCNGLDTKAARRVCPRELWTQAQKRLSQLDYAASLGDLRLPKSNRLHRLGRDRKDQYSISVNMEYRICFRWTGAGPDQVEITDYH
jgi:toxin HigB-1